MEIVHHIHEQTGNQNFKPSDISDRFTIQDMVDSVNRDLSSAGVVCVRQYDQDSDSIYEEDNGSLVDNDSVSSAT